MPQRWRTVLLAVVLCFWFSPPPGLAGQEELQEAMKLTDEVGQLHRAGRYRDAVPVAQKALQIRYKNLGPEHPDIAASLTKLGLLYQALGSMDEALPLLERALQIRYKSLSPDHPDTAASLQNLAEFYRAAGSPDKALPLLERALRTREKVLGPEHPDTAASLQALGVHHQDRGEYAKAKPLYERALSLRQKALTPNHPDTASSLNSLGELHRLLGAYDLALVMNERALQINEQVYGSLHSNTALSLNNLATLYHAMGFYSRARPLYERALQIRQKALGLEHPATAQSLNNLAMCYQSQKEFDQAIPLYQRAMTIREKVLPAGHPDLAASRHHLATLHRDLGDAAKALSLFAEAVAMREQALGPDHPETAVTLQHLAACHQEMGSPGKAIPLYDRVWKIREKTMGADHPLTLGSLNTLALTHRAAGEYNQALALYTRAWQLREKALGPEHADTLASLSTLAALYFDTGASSKALSLYTQTAQAREKSLGPNHPETAVSLENLAQVYQAQADYDKALSLYERSLKIKAAALHPEHPALAETLLKAGAMYQNQGALDKALPLAAQAVALREKALGPDHPDTAAGLEQLAGLYAALGWSAKALPLSQRAAKIVEQAKGANHLATARSLQKLAAVHQALGDDDKALALFERLAPVLEKTLGPQHPDTATVWAQVGLVYHSRQDQDKAQEIFRRVKSPLAQIDVALALGRYEDAWQILEDMPPPLVSTPAFQIRYYTQRGRVLAGVGRLPEAAVAFWQALQGVEKRPLRPPATPLQLSPGAMNLQPFQGLVTVLTELARTGGEIPPQLQEFGPGAQTAAFSLAEAAKARALLNALAQSPRSPQRAGLSPELRQRQQDLDLRLAANEAQWDRAANGGQEGLQEAIATRKKLVQDLEALVDELRLTQPLHAALDYPQTVPIRHLPLAGDEVLLSYALGEDHGIIFVVRQDGVQYLHPLPLSRQELEKLVREFLTPLLQGQPGSFSLEHGRRLYDLLLAKPLATVGADEQVFIVPDGILGLLPFEALVVNPGQTPETSVFVGDQRRLRYYPAAAVLAQQRGRAAMPPTRPLFALGNPVSEPPADRPRGTPPETLGLEAASGTATAPPDNLAALLSHSPSRTPPISYPPLPASESIIRDLAHLFNLPAEPPDVLLGPAASETGLRRAPLAAYRYLHFAVHADFSDKTPGKLEPLLALGQAGNNLPDDGFLTLAEVLDLNLGARLVTLSHGHTGMGPAATGEGVLHLARAFHYAGAKNVLINLWDSRPEVAQEFWRQFYGLLQVGHSPGEALDRARRELRQAYPDPVFWAGLVLYGE